MDDIRLFVVLVTPSFAERILLLECLLIICVLKYFRLFVFVVLFLLKSGIQDQSQVIVNRERLSESANKPTGILDYRYAISYQVPGGIPTLFFKRLVSNLLQVR